MKPTYLYLVNYTTINRNNDDEIINSSILVNQESETLAGELAVGILECLWSENATIQEVVMIRESTVDDMEKYYTQVFLYELLEAE